MKKTILTTLTLVLVFLGSVNAQDTKPGEYFPFPQNKKFEGTWQAKTTNWSVQIKLTNIERVFIKSVNIYMDHLNGVVTYIKDGDTVINNENLIHNGVCKVKYNPYLFRAAFWDEKGKSGRIKGVFLDKTDLNTLTISLTALRGINDPKPFRLPEKLTLKKVN